jgi:hypothetical protein
MDTFANPGKTGCPKALVKVRELMDEIQLA